MGDAAMGDVVADGEKAKETAELPLEVSDTAT